CDAVSVPADAQVAYEFKFRARKNLTGRVVGRVQDDGLGMRTKGGGQFGVVERPVLFGGAGRTHAHEAGRCAGQDRVRAVVFIERLEHNDLVAGIDDGHYGGHHGFGRAAANRDLTFRVIGDGLRALEFFDNGVAQRLRTPGDGVLIDVVGDSLTSG